MIVQLGQLKLLDFQHLELRVDLLAPQGRIRGVVRQLGLGGPRLTGRNPRHQLVELLDPAVTEAQNGPDANDLFGGAGNHLVPVLERQVRRDVIAFFRRPVVGDQPTTIGQHVLQCPVHVGIAELANRPLNGQPLPLWQIELRADLQVELERQGPVLRDFDRIQVDIRLADRREVFFVVDL